MSSARDALGERPGRGDWGLLEELVTTPGVPGREERVRAVIAAHADRLGLFDELRTDALGSLIGVRRPRPAADGAGPSPRVLVAAHMDQVGFLVAHVSAAGHLRLHPVGAFDPRTLVAQRVLVCTEDGDDLPGLLMPPSPPVHTATAEELRKTPELAELFVDLGLPADEARARVRLGDMVVLDAPFRALGPAFAGPAMDDRIGCWALLAALAGLERHACEIHAVWSAQEEVGSRGVEPASFGIEADIGIVCDTTVCCDLPGIAAEREITRFGGGVALQIADSSTLSDMALVRRIEALADDQGLACQRSLMLGGGQDGALIQRSRHGVPTIVLVCPVRYMHTAAELVHGDDLNAFQDLLRTLLATLGPDDARRREDYAPAPTHPGSR